MDKNTPVRTRTLLVTLLQSTMASPVSQSTALATRESLTLAQLTQLILSKGHSFSALEFSHSIEFQVSLCKWRRGRDSNPRWVSTHTPLAGERLQPLGHLSIGMMRRALARLTGFEPVIASFVDWCLIQFGHRRIVWHNRSAENILSDQLLAKRFNRP